jgi:hypothetical protein
MTIDKYNFENCFLHRNRMRSIPKNNDPPQMKGFTGHKWQWTSADHPHSAEKLSFSALLAKTLRGKE